MSAERRLLYWTVGLVLFGAALYVLRGILLPFVAGIAIAYVLDPLADRLERWRCPRALAAVLLVVLFFVLFVLFFALLVPLLQDQVVRLVTKAPDYAAGLRRWVADLLALLETRLSAEMAEKLREAAGSIAGDAAKWLGEVLKGVLTSGVAVFEFIGLVVITPLVAFYLLRDWNRILAYLDGLLPRKEAGAVRQIAREIDERLAAFARGQALVCFILAVFYGGGLEIIGLDFALIVGVIAGFLSFVPTFGALIGFVLSVGLAAAQFGAWVPIALVAGLFVVGQVVEGNFLTPNIVGERVGLHPVWIIFALLAGGTLLGAVGLLLAVPAAAAIGVLVRFGVARYRAGEFYDADGGAR